MSSLSLMVMCSFQSVLSNCRVLYQIAEYYILMVLHIGNCQLLLLGCSFGRLKLIIVYPIIMVYFIIIPQEPFLK